MKNEGAPNNCLGSSGYFSIPEFPAPINVLSND
jgi:hypothetical protein